MESPNQPSKILPETKLNDSASGEIICPGSRRRAWVGRTIRGANYFTSPSVAIDGRNEVIPLPPSATVLRGRCFDLGDHLFKIRASFDLLSIAKIHPTAGAVLARLAGLAKSRRVKAIMPRSRGKAREELPCGQANDRFHIHWDRRATETTLTNIIFRLKGCNKTNFTRKSFLIRLIDLKDGPLKCFPSIFPNSCVETHPLIRTAESGGSMSVLSNDKRSASDANVPLGVFRIRRDINNIHSRNYRIFPIFVQGII